MLTVLPGVLSNLRYISSKPCRIQQDCSASETTRMETQAPCRHRAPTVLDQALDPCSHTAIQGTYQAGPALTAERHAAARQACGCPLHAEDVCFPLCTCWTFQPGHMVTQGTLRNSLTFSTFILGLTVCSSDHSTIPVTILETHSAFA